MEQGNGQVSIRVSSESLHIEGKDVSTDLLLLAVDSHRALARQNAREEKTAKKRDDLGQLAQYALICLALFFSFGAFFGGCEQKPHHQQQQWGSAQ